MKALLFILVLAGLLCGERSTNWTGYLDTVSMPACSSTALVYSGTVFSLTDYDMVRVVCMVNDTSSAGFASDSIHLRWGYQTFTYCRNSSGSMDTCYSPRVVVDTVKSDSTSFGTMAVLTLDGDGIANTPGKQVDTSSCSGYAVQSRTFSAEWDVYYRLWAEGIAGNYTAAPLVLKFTNIRRVFRPAAGR